MIVQITFFETEDKARVLIGKMLSVTSIDFKWRITLEVARWLNLPAAAKIVLWSLNGL